jgi:hypothetical protein
LVLLPFLTILKYVCSFAAQMNLPGNHKAIPSGSEKAQVLIRHVIVAFFLVVFAHTAVQLTFTGFASIGEILGIKEGPTAANVFYQPVHNPQHSGTALPVAEFLKETEVQEKPHLDKVYSFHSDFDLIKSASIGKSENLYRGFLRSLQNRPELSLIILHHSWKSYLS